MEGKPVRKAMATMRLNKYLSEKGLCSRREADRWIAEKKVTVDGSVAFLGMQIEEGQEVCVDGKKVGGSPQKVVLAVYKPVGIVCTEEKKEKNNIIRFVNYPKRVTYAGRLDKESEGLILMTNDGKLIQDMMRSRNGHEKEYEVWIDRPVTDAFLRQMEQGVRLVDEEKGLDEVTRPCKVRRLGEKRFSIILTQGLNRQIRRMCRALGCKVERLIRIRVVNITLEGMKCGQIRELSEQEKRKLYERVKKSQNGRIDRTTK